MPTAHQYANDSDIPSVPTSTSVPPDPHADKPVAHAVRPVPDPEAVFLEDDEVVAPDFEVLGYGEVVHSIAETTGLPKAHVRRVLDHYTFVVINHTTANVGNRVRLGRLGTFFSRKTKERQVNNPQAPGTFVTSPSHVQLRFNPGTNAKDAMRGDIDFITRKEIS